MSADRNASDGLPLLFSLDVKFVNVSRKRNLVTRLRPGLSGVQTMARARNFPDLKKCRQALVPTQPCIQSIPGTISPRIGRPGREADHSPLEVFRGIPQLLQTHGMIVPQDTPWPSSSISYPIHDLPFILHSTQSWDVNGVVKQTINELGVNQCSSPTSVNTCCWIDRYCRTQGAHIHAVFCNSRHIMDRTEIWHPLITIWNKKVWPSFPSNVCTVSVSHHIL